MCRREALWCAFNTGPAGTPGIRGAVAKRFDSITAAFCAAALSPRPERHRRPSCSCRALRSKTRRFFFFFFFQFNSDRGQKTEDGSTWHPLPLSVGVRVFCFCFVFFSLPVKWGARLYFSLRGFWAAHGQEGAEGRDSPYDWIDWTLKLLLKLPRVAVAIGPLGYA